MKEGRTAPQETRRRVPVWDLPTRLFHWAFAATICGGLGTGLAGAMDWHLRCGFASLALLLFRLFWGVWGSESARFRTFLRPPAAVLRHLRHLTRAEPDGETSHNPAGGWMALLLLLAIAAQILTGLCASDGVMTSGPLADLVGDAWSDRLTHWHAAILKPLLFVLLGLHILAIGFYALVKRQNLVAPMLTGDKNLPSGTRPPAMRGWPRALALFAVAAACAWYVATRG